MSGVAQIELPDLGGNLVVVGQTLWAATDAGAVLVDPATGDVSEAIPDVTNLAFDGERLWAGGEKLLMEIDPKTGRTLRQFSPEHNAFYVAATPDAVWASDTFGAVVQRFDPADGHVVGIIEVPSKPKGTTLGEGSLWVACDGAATVVRIDTTSGETVAEIPVGYGPHNIAVGGGWVWVTNRHSRSLSKIDPATNQVVATVAGVAHSPAVGVAVGPASVYVAYSGGLALVDPERAEITARFAIEGADFYDLKLIDDTLWASNASGTILYGIGIDALSGG